MRSAQAQSRAAYSKDAIGEMRIQGAMEASTTNFDPINAIQISDGRGPSRVDANARMHRRHVGVVEDHVRSRATADGAARRWAGPLDAVP